MSRGAIALGAALLIGGCHRELPENIPYQASVSVKENGGGVEVRGGDLMLDGRKIARLDAKGELGGIAGLWTTPKSELRSTLKGKYSVLLDGACGAFSLPVGGPPANFASKSDDEAAEIVSKRKFFPVYLDVELPKPHTLYIDRGVSTGVLRVGKTTIESGKKTLPISLAGCTGSVPVTLDGAPLGSLDVGVEVNLITLEPGVCHVERDVVYGNSVLPPTSTNYPARGVTGLSRAPTHFLEAAPDKARSYADDKNRVTTVELLRGRCQ